MSTDDIDDTATTLDSAALAGLLALTPEGLADAVARGIVTPLPSGRFDLSCVRRYVVHARDGELRRGWRTTPTATPEAAWQRILAEVSDALLGVPEMVPARRRPAVRAEVGRALANAAADFPDLALPAGIAELTATRGADTICDRARALHRQLVDDLLQSPSADSLTPREWSAMEHAILTALRIMPSGEDAQ